jgi:hypothetical protein
MQKRCICSFVIDEFGFLSSFVLPHWRQQVCARSRTTPTPPKSH